MVRNVGGFLAEGRSGRSTTDGLCSYCLLHLIQDGGGRVAEVGSRVGSVLDQRKWYWWNWYERGAQLKSPRYNECVVAYGTIWGRMGGRRGGRDDDDG